ncbi:transposase [Methylobacterium sp. WL18]|nr:transposase [Methylobacterium sp. WL18]
MSALLKAAGWFVNDKRVERIWRRASLKVPARRHKRGGPGTTTAPAFVFARNTAITRVLTSSMPIHTMDARSGCSASSTGSRTNAWRSESPAS